MATATISKWSAVKADGQILEINLVPEIKNKNVLKPAQISSLQLLAAPLVSSLNTLKKGDDRMLKL